MVPNDDTRDSVYDYYDMMGDNELIKEMEDAVGVLQMSNQEDLAIALHAFIDRFTDVVEDYQTALRRLEERN